MQPITFLNVSVDLLRKNPWNTNKCSPETEAKIRKSLERNGMFKPILVREVEGIDGYEIIGGEHRWEQAVDLGHEEVPVANLGLIDDRRAKEIGVIDNARYGADDTLSFGELLKELGDVGDLQEFLPYGQADLDAIFSASVIDLGELELDENFDSAEENLPAEKAEKPAKTHTVMRFKISLGDAERLTALIASTQKSQGFTTADDLTNAGDALVHLLSTSLPSAAAPTITTEQDDIEAMLDAALKEHQV